jgi:hypothetical protein
MGRMPGCLLALALASQLAACGGAKGDLAADSAAALDDPVEVAAVGHEADLKRSGQPSRTEGDGTLAAVVATMPAVSPTAPPTTPAVSPTPPPTTVAVATPVVPTIEPGSAGLSVDTRSLPLAKPGVSVPMLTAAGPIPPPLSDPAEEGAFRLNCNWSKMSYDDPIVYPGQPGAAHHHTFFGNTGIDAFTTAENIRSKGNATCRGGTINLSGYWTPSLIDTTTGKPLPPQHIIVYYKTGIWTYMGDRLAMQTLPAGLRMITGNPGGSAPPADAVSGTAEFSCFDTVAGGNREGTWGRQIPAACRPGDLLRWRIGFRQCWDGINLDSPDHQSHMADVVRMPGSDPRYDPYHPYMCPASHPVVLPKITFTLDYAIPAGVPAGKLRLSSDTYASASPGGYSAHADWMNGWDKTVSDVWGVKCMRERRECGSANMGDGRSTIEFQGN